MPRPRDILLVPLLAAVAFAGIGWGTRSTYRALGNRSPMSTTCADFLAHRDAADWVRLEGCEPGLEHIGTERYVDNRRPNMVGAPSAIYIPLRVPTDKGEDRVKLLLRVDGGPILRLGADHPSEAEVRLAQEVLAQPIEGLVERSLDRSARDRDKIRDLGLYLADDFLIIDYDAKPRPLWLGLGALSVGLGAAALLARKWRRRRRPPELARARVV